MGFPNQHLLEQTNRYDEGVHPEMGERPPISDNLNVELRNILKNHGVENHWVEQASKFSEASMDRQNVKIHGWDHEPQQGWNHASAGQSRVSADHTGGWAQWLGHWVTWVLGFCGQGRSVKLAHGYAVLAVLVIYCNVGKAIINHPPNHHFYRWYKTFPNGWFMIVLPIILCIPICH